MKKYILTIMLFSLGFAGYAQVGIGTASPTLTLEVVGANDNGAVTGVDGVLVPRVNDADMSTATDGTVDGQMVYNTVAKKFYYWNGTAWTAVGTVINNVITTSSITPTYNDENVIIYTGPSQNFTLPDPADYNNKFISFINAGSGSAQFITNIPNRTACSVNRGYLFFSDGTSWYNAGGF